MEKAIFYWGVIFSVAIGCMEMVKHLDERKWEWSFAEYRTLFWSSGVNGFLLWQIVRNDSVSDSGAGLLSLVAGCLLFACMTDWKSCEVFAFTWWIGGTAGGFLLLQKYVTGYWIGEPRTPVIQQLIPLLLYILMQEIFFERFYGRADCHAFVICALIETVLGMGMLEFLLHMLMAFGLLAVVQMPQGNINSKGNLKRPVAFLPYITISFWVLLFFEKNVILERISKTIYIGGLGL